MVGDVSTAAGTAWQNGLRANATCFGVAAELPRLTGHAALALSQTDRRWRLKENWPVNIISKLRNWPTLQKRRAALPAQLGGIFQTIYSLPGRCPNVLR
jgi:hypothetical protein